ncbi:MAG: portal protein [Planctomycetes bacterium]|nr:portal protein [Planctomycetota bacterium]
MKTIGMTRQEMRELHPAQRALLNVQPPLLHRLVESTPLLKRWQGLRHMVGLDLDVTADAGFMLPGGSAEEQLEVAQWYRQQFQLGLDRRTIYQSVEEMDNYGPITSALDLYAEEATQPDGRTGKTIWVESPNTEVKDLLDALLLDLEIEDNAYGICRTMCKYGDAPVQLLVDTRDGVVGIHALRPAQVTTVRDRYGIIRGHAAGLVDTTEILRVGSEEALAKFKTTYEMALPWAIVPFTLRGGALVTGFGESLLLPIRSLWRQLKIMEDTLVLYRLYRMPDRLAYKIDTTGLNPDQAQRRINEFRKAMRKKFHYSSATGQFRQEYHPYSAMDDLFIPIQTGKSDGIEKLAGSSNSDQLFDVEHIRNMFFACLRIPKAYMGFEEDVNAKATLAQQDIRFARLTRRIRRGFVQHVADICRVHMILRGLDPYDRKNEFTLRMSPVAMLEEIQRAEAVSLIWQTVSSMLEGIEKMGLSGRGRISYISYILTEYGGFSHSQVTEFLRDAQVASDHGGGLGGGGGGGGAPAFGTDLLAGADGGGPADAPTPGNDAEPQFGSDIEPTGDTTQPAGTPDAETIVSSLISRGEDTARRLLAEELAGSTSARSSQRSRVDMERLNVARKAKADQAQALEALATEANSWDLLRGERRAEEQRRAQVLAKDGAPCPGRGCHGTLRLVEQKLENAPAKQYLLCRRCSFGAEVE